MANYRPLDDKRWCSQVQTIRHCIFAHNERSKNSMINSLLELYPHGADIYPRRLKEISKDLNRSNIPTQRYRNPITRQDKREKKEKEERLTTKAEKHIHTLHSSTMLAIHENNAPCHWEPV